MDWLKDKEGERTAIVIKSGEWSMSLLHGYWNEAEALEIDSVLYMAKNGEKIVEIDGDGEITYGEDYHPAETAFRFWEMLTLLDPVERGLEAYAERNR